MRWAWGEKHWPDGHRDPVAANAWPTANHWRAAATADQRKSSGPAEWAVIEGLGPSGRAVALEPANLDANWGVSDTNAPALAREFTSKTVGAEAGVDFLPAFRIYRGMKLRVTVAVDNQPAILVEVPGASGDENEIGTIRSAAVQNNYVRARTPLANLPAGRHTLVIRAVDPGVVIDQVSLP